MKRSARRTSLTDRYSVGSNSVHAPSPSSIPETPANELREGGLRLVETVERERPVVVAILGVLRAGAIYTLMPLDWPVARRREVLHRTAARLCLTRDSDRSAKLARELAALRGRAHDRTEPPPADPEEQRDA